MKKVQYKQSVQIYSESCLYNIYDKQDLLANFKKYSEKYDGIYIEFELSYDNCYYEADSPTVHMVWYGYEK